MGTQKLTVYTSVACMVGERDTTSMNVDKLMAHAQEPTNLSRSQSEGNCQS